MWKFSREERRARGSSRRRVVGRRASKGREDKCSRVCVDVCVGDNKEMTEKEDEEEDEYKRVQGKNRQQ